MKKHLLLLFTALLPLVASAQTTVEIGGIWYNLTAETSEAEVTSSGGTKYAGSITLPATVTYDGVAYSVTSIGGSAFRYCYSLTAITIPEGVTSIGGYAFDRCSSLTAIVVAEGNKVYDSRGGCNAIIETSTNTLLRGCSSTIIPEGVTSIGEGAFSGCTNLTAITLPESVTSIGNYAFQYCQNLAYISVRASVLNIGDYAFMCCNIKNFVVFSNNVIFGHCVFEDGNVYKYIDYSGQMRYNAHGAYVRIEADEITTIGDYQFRTTNSGHYLTNYIGNDTEITLPDSYLGENYKIDVAAFAGRHITSMNIPKSVDAIELYAFYGCPSLTAITLPEGVTSIGIYAFSGCSSLTAVNIPEGVTSIGNYAFEDCISLTAITLPESLTSIGWHAFSGCSSLTDINIPEGVTSIGKSAFSGCSSLTAVTLPESLTSIGESAFSGCRSLTAVTLPESLTSIGKSAFSGCSSLTSILVAEENKVYDSRSGCNAIIETASNTLVAGCSTTIIPESVTSIGGSAFYRCTSLTSITIPEGVTSIRWNAFEGCTSLTAITFPESLTSIGGSAFWDCNSLTAITCHAVTPPTIGYSAFYGVDKSIPVNVPAGSVEAYKTAEYWSEFTNIRPIEADIAEGDYYLKHVGSGKFLTGANNWGTQASLGDYGISITLERLPNGKYTLDTHVANTATDHYLGGIGNTGYVDAPVAEWIISESESGTYTLTLDGTNYWGYDGSSTVLETTLTDPTKRNAQWQLVTRAELESALSRATLNRGIDATFLIQGHSFNRNHNENAAWMGGPVLGGPVSNFCAEKWNATPVDVYQELVGIPNGYYTLEVQGFYRDAENPTITAERRAMGTEQLRARLYAGDRSVALMSILDEATPEQSDGGLSTTYGWVPNTMSEAASYFASGLYPNKVDAWVTDGTLRIGIRKESGESGDWVIFDNFRLTYYGSQKPAGIEQPGTDEAPLLIYDLMGRKVTDTENLTGGIYIIGGKKVIIK